MAKRSTKAKTPTKRKTTTKASPRRRKANEQAAPSMADTKEHELQRAIGRFVIEFSQLEFTLRAQIADRIDLIEPYFDAVLGWWDFSKLCQTLGALAEIDLAEHPVQLAARKKVISEVMRVNTERVRIVHSLWTLNASGWSARRVVAGKTKPEFHFQDIVTLYALSDRANKLIIELYGL